MKKRKSVWFFILAIVLLAASLACSSSVSLGDNSQNQSQEGENSNTIQVVAKEFSFSLDSSQSKAGTITFVIQNDGSMNHDFAIRGNGVEEKTPMIEPGESATLEVDLEPGTYTYVCTIPGHEQLGMSGTFTVASN